MLKIFKCLYCQKENPCKKNHMHKYCNNMCQRLHSITEAMNGDSPTKGVAQNYMRKFVEYKCVHCGIGSEYNGKPITLQIDHINGVRTDHRKVNLRWLCPNCHSQTETWGYKNVSDEGKRKIQLALNGK
jgi:hypothetical protein